MTRGECDRSRLATRRRWGRVAGFVSRGTEPTARGQDRDGRRSAAQPAVTGIDSENSAEKIRPKKMIQPNTVFDLNRPRH